MEQHDERAITAALSVEAAGEPDLQSTQCCFPHDSPTYPACCASPKPCCGKFIEDREHLINPTTLLPKNLTYYRYFGSYTTPPCHEGVIWAVMHDPIEVSTEQIRRFRALVGHDNARPTQPLHKRFVLESILDRASIDTKHR
jgi:hypothetical protein